MPDWCSEWKKNGRCHEAQCTSQHFIRDARLRVQFKTEMCPEGSDCRQWQCIDAHSRRELRCLAYARDRVCRDRNCRFFHPGREDDAAPDVMPPSDEHQQLQFSSVGKKPRRGQVHYRRALPPLPPLLPGVARSKAEARLTFQPPESAVRDLYLARQQANAVKRPEAVGPLVKLYRQQLIVEHSQECHDIRAFDAVLTHLQPSSSGRLYHIPVPGLAERRPSVLKGDAVLVKCIASGRVHKGYVHSVHLAEVLCDFEYRFSASESVLVQFTAPKGPIMLQHRAIREAPFHLAPKLLHPNTANEALHPGNRQTLISLLERHGIWRGLDESQQLFLATFLRCRSAINMLHGPPGTGKTTTVVATLQALRVLDLPENHRVLVCTPSNQSADLVVERMLERSDAYDRRELKKEILRVNALSRDPKDIPAAIKDVCPDPGTLPALHELKQKRMVVCTLCTAGKLYGIGDEGYDMLIVDEAGQATEQELLVALCLLRSAPVKGRIVLAGDHKQLGPIIRNVHCRRVGMDVSPLQRLMQSASEAACHTMLTHNYRAHPSIISLYNPTYDNRLIAASRSALHTLRFVNQAPFVGDHPVMALHVDGVEAQEADSPSWKNDLEAEAVIELVGMILSRTKARPADIVVLSGYAKQCTVLREQLRLRFYTAAEGTPFFLRNDERTRAQGRCPIEVCSVEKFQGREAPLVIMSCVRSRDLAAVQRDMYIGLGFLSNPQRLNVAISRPQAGLCIVGNLNLLANDPLWAQVLRRIAELRGLRRRAPGEHGFGIQYESMAWREVEAESRRMRDAYAKARDSAQKGTAPAGGPRSGATAEDLPWREHS